MPYHVIQIKEHQFGMIGPAGVESITKPCWVIASPAPFYSIHAAVVWKNEQPNKDDLIIIQYFE